MQEAMVKDGKGQKEIHSLQKVLDGLTGKQLVRNTFANGFHVVPDVMALDVDSSAFNPEHELSDRCSQPVVDEEALDPCEYTLINSLFDQKRPRQSTALAPRRDYASLDYTLINLNRSVRKHCCSSFLAVEEQLKAFVAASSAHIPGFRESEYESNPAAYQGVLDDKKQFLKVQLKAR